MVDKEVLSQEEIDALLTNVDDDGKGSDEDTSFSTDDAQKSEPEEQEVKIINFTNQERIVRGELPVLERIHDRAIKLFANDLYRTIGKDLELKQEPLLIIKNQDFVEALPNPTLAKIYRFKPLRGKAVILYDSIFIYNIVDNYFGGSSQFLAQKDRFDFTSTELNVMEDLTKKLLKNIESAWTSILKLSCMKLSEEMNPQLMNFSEPNEMLLVIRFLVDFGKEQGSFSIIFPYSMIEPIKQRLEFGASRPDDETDPNWVMSLQEEIMHVELVLRGSMKGENSTLGKVLHWQVNDFIPLELNDTVMIDIEGTPIFIGTLGRANDKCAVKIEKKIS